MKMDRESWRQAVAEATNLAQAAAHHRDFLIRQARENGEFSLRQLAEMTQLSHQTISNILKKETAP